MTAYLQPKVLAYKWGGSAVTGDAQGTILKFDTPDLEVTPTGAAEKPMGILLTSGPIAVGDNVEVVVQGGAKAKVGAAGIAKGASVASDSAGLAIAATAGEWSIAVTEETGASADFVPVLVDLHKA